jgi:hypothetical protein
VVHQRQGLPLGFEAGDHFAGIEPRLDDLQRHPTAHGVLLFGHEHQAHAPLADLFPQFVGADQRAGTFLDGWSVQRDRGGPLQKIARLSMIFE